MRLDLDGLGDASREELMSEWREVMGRPPPKHLSRHLMVQILSHAYQHSQGLLKLNCRISAHIPRQPHARARWHGTGPGAAVPKIKMCTRSAREFRYIQTNSTPLQRNVSKSIVNQGIAYTESEPRAHARACTY